MTNDGLMIKDKLSVGLETNRERQTQGSAPTFEIKKAFFLKKAFLAILELFLIEYLFLILYPDWILALSSHW